MPTRTGSSSILALTGRQRGLSVVFCHLVHVIAAPYLSDSDRQLRLCATRAHAEGAVPSGMCPPWSRGESTAGSLRDDSKRAVLSFQEPSVSFSPLNFYLLLWAEDRSKRTPQPMRKVRGQFVGIGSLLPRCGSWGFNSGHWVWWQAPLSSRQT